MRALSVVAGLLLLVLGGYGLFRYSFDNANTFADRARRDEIEKVAKDDPDMAAAFRKSRETLPQFLALARAPRPTIIHLAVKVGVSTDDDDGKEFFWISPFGPLSGRYAGSINNTPRSAKTVVRGQIIEFSEDEIVDWLYIEEGKMHGNFTACALLKRESPEQMEVARKEFGLSCDP
jgi:uncharacterized protein YegJ (DUF2314 family)